MDNIKWKIKNIHTGEIIDISKSLFKVGRDSNADLSSRLIAMSRKQATFSILLDGNLYIQDNDSTNGTFLNNIKINSKEPTIVRNRDVIGFGCCQKTSGIQNSEMMTLLYEVINELENDSIENHDQNCVSEDLTFKIAQTKDNTFSTNDDHCILISDGEDDDKSPFACSQIFELSKRIKEEQTSLSESIDPYSDIKQELQDLDCCDVSNQVPIDLTDDVDHFENTADLVNVLESPRVLNKNNESSNILQKEMCKNNHIFETSNILQHDVGMEISNTINSNTHTRQECSKNLLDVVSNVSPGKLKYVKPPVIEPHFISKPSVSKETINSKMKEKVKRKSISNDDLTESKKFKSNRNISNKDKKNNVKYTKTRSSQRKGAEKEIKEDRKKRLKELTGKHNNENLNKNEKHTKNVAHLKNSENRGNFLLDEIPSTSFCARNNTDRPAKTKIKHGSRKHETEVGSPVDQAVIVSDEIQDTTISSNYSPDTKTKTPIQSTIAYPDMNKKQFSNPDSTVHDNRSGLIWQLSLNRNPTIVSNRYRNLDNVDEYISLIVHWSVKWITEQNCSDISPPVNGSKHPEMVPIQFNSFENYLNIFQPLVMLELWQFIYQTLYNKDEERKPVYVRITHERKVGNLLFLDGECQFSDKDFKTNNIFRTDDFALIELKFRDSNNNYLYTGFSYIKSCTRINNNTREGAVHGSNYKFTLITRNLDKQIIGDQMLVKVISSIASSLKLLKTIKYLDRSPLRRNILNPETSSYQVPMNRPKLEVENRLNDRQREIVSEALSICLSDQPGMYLIKGPPGTGKSTVIINIILESIFASAKLGKAPLILLTAPSNAAIDGLIMKLAKVRCKLPNDRRKLLKMVRIGPDSSISKEVNKFKVSVLAQNHLILENGFNTLEEYKTHCESGAAIDEFLRKKLGNKYFYEMKRVEDIILLGSHVICTTLNSCVSYRIIHPLRKGDLRKFTCCIIDEATQCNELESLLPIQLGVERIVLVGDPQQLPAVVCNKEAQQLGYGRSLFSRIADSFIGNINSPIKMLLDQYRMHPDICDYPNRTFYQSKLRSLPVCKNVIAPSIKPYVLFNFNRPGNSDNDNSDYINTDEATFICNLLDTLNQYVTTSHYSVGIITPYRAQTQLLRKRLSSTKFKDTITVNVNTVDSFQGIENDIIIISCVRYSNNYFLQNEQRLNVALTRAKQALFIVGNYTLFKHCKPLYNLREDAKKRKLCFDIKDDPKNIPSMRKFIFT